MIEDTTTIWRNQVFIHRLIRKLKRRLESKLTRSELQKGALGFLPFGTTVSALLRGYEGSGQSKNGLLAKRTVSDS